MRGQVLWVRRRKLSPRAGRRTTRPPQAKGKSALRLLRDSNRVGRTAPSRGESLTAADSHPQVIAPHISHPGGFRHRNRIPAKSPVPESSTGGRAQAVGRRFEALRPCWATSLKPELSGPPCPSPGADKGRFFPLSAEVELCAGRLEGCRHGRCEPPPHRLRPGYVQKNLRHRDDALLGKSLKNLCSLKGREKAVL